jgi:hypothetical protein
MIIPQKEVSHIINILHQTKTFLLEKNPSKLKNLSNNTIHNACNYQDSASITIAVLIYALSKLIERQDFSRFKNWDLFVKKFNSQLDLAIKSLEQEKFEKYADYIALARKNIESHSISLKPYISEVLKKAAINKGGKIYEHGLSLEQTSKLLGISQWELADYIGSRTFDNKNLRTIDIKKRAKMALEFFS